MICKYYGCSSLTNIEIPTSVTKIDHYAFDGCTNLASIKVNWTTPPVSEWPREFSFDGVDKSTCTLYVPKGTAELYKSAPVWNEFTNIREF